MDFGRKKPAPLYNVVHNPNNPLNWFERMRLRQKEKPVMLNSNIAQVQRSASAREQAMVAKSGSGNQREVGKLAAMDPVEYYKTRSGVLNLARSDPILIKKIREASVPNDTALAEAVLGEAPAEVVGEGDAGPPPAGGGASEGGASEGASEGGDAPAEAVGGGGSEPAAAEPVAEPVAEPITKKALDKALKDGSELEPEQLKTLAAKAVALDAIEKMFVPLKSGDKNTVRDGLNYFIQQTLEFNRLKNAGNEVKLMEWPNGIEIRKTTNSGIIGRLYVDGYEIDKYVEINKAKIPEITEKLGKLAALFTVIQESTKIERKQEGTPGLEGDLTEEQILEIMDKEYPLLREVFSNLQKQIDNSLKPYRPKRKGGRGKGVLNKPKAKSGGSGMVAATLEGGSEDGNEGGDEA